MAKPVLTVVGAAPDERTNLEKVRSRITVLHRAGSLTAEEAAGGLFALETLDAMNALDARRAAAAAEGRSHG